jgi:hypothetical protein
MVQPTLVTHQRHAEHTIVTKAMRRYSATFNRPATFMLVPVVRRKRPAPASFCVSPMNAREAGLPLGLEAHEWHLLFSWTDRSGPSRHLCPGALDAPLGCEQPRDLLGVPTVPACRGK